MNGLPYYKAYPRDFIEGTIGMDFELKAAYRLVLDLIYMQGGQLPDDARYISGLLGCSLKKWNSLREKLVGLGKIEVRNGYLGNLRADKELETLGKYQDQQRENRNRPNKNKDLKTPPTHHTEPEPESDKIIIKSDDVDDVQPKLKRRSEILALMGLDGSGVTPDGKFTGGTNDQQEMAKWDGLGLTHQQQDAKIREMLASKRTKNPGFIPTTWAYFTTGMQSLAEAKTGTPRAGTTSPTETPEQRQRRYRKMIGG